MICQKCGKEITGDGVKFCPFCGKALPKENRPTMTNAEYLMFIDDKEFSELWAELRTLDAETALKQFREMHPAVHLYGICARYRRNVDDKCRTTHVSKCDLADILSDQRMMLLSVSISTYSLSKSYSPKDLGEWLFRTKEECEAAIKEVCGGAPNSRRR